MDSNKSNSRIEFDEASHTYRVDGKIVPSVTQLLPKQDYFVSDERLAECAAEGTANHKEIEEFMRMGVSTSPLTDAMQKFMDEQKDKTGGLVACEMPLASTRGFAGTPDLIFENAIVDLKRTCGNKKIHALQLAGYNLLAVENGINHSTKLHYILVLRTDGGYDVTNVYDSMAENIFLGLLSKYKIEKSLEYYLNKI
jgi:hypothetical protein